MRIPTYPIIFLLGFLLGVLVVKINNPEVISLSVIASTLVYHLVSAVIFYIVTVITGLFLLNSILGGLRSIDKTLEDIIESKAVQDIIKSKEFKEFEAISVDESIERNDYTNRH